MHKKLSRELYRCVVGRAVIVVQSAAIINLKREKLKLVLLFADYSTGS
jgi:hypothetical protein